MDARRRKGFRRTLHGAGFGQTCGCPRASEQPPGVFLYRISNADHNAHFHGNGYAYAELDAHLHADANAHPNPDAHAYSDPHGYLHAHAVGYRHRYVDAAAANSHVHGIRHAAPDTYRRAHVDAYARADSNVHGCAHCVANGCAVLDGNPYADGNAVAAIYNGAAIGEAGDAHAAAANSHHSRPCRHRRRADSSHCDCRYAAVKRCRAAADCARSG